MNEIKAVDLFCGAGGTSAGLKAACSAAGKRLNLLAINHWNPAVKTHRYNHPEFDHLCAEIDSLNPLKVYPWKNLDILIASPDCTHHSIAKGGQPRSDQSRASPWLVLKWVEDLRPHTILIENVRELEQWGPLDASGRPIKSRKGEIFQAFIAALRSLNYDIEWRLLCSADYGDPTTRERLFIIARRPRRTILWPEKSHSQDGSTGRMWRSARDHVIDWSLKGQSIFSRKTPLRPATLRRIAVGLERFGGVHAGPFLALLRGTSTVRSVDLPIPTLTAGGGHLALIEPFLIRYNGSHSGKDDGDNRVQSVDRPIGTLDTSNRYGLCEPFVLGQQSCAAPRSVAQPLPTIATAGAISLIEPFLVRYNGNGAVQSIDAPLPTITTKDRFGLVDTLAFDILFRMLQPHELAAAMGLEHYRWVGTKTEVVKMIGNAVSFYTACALGSVMVA